MKKGKLISVSLAFIILALHSIIPHVHHTDGKLPHLHATNYSKPGMLQMLATLVSENIGEGHLEHYDLAQEFDHNNLVSVQGIMPTSLELRYNNEHLYTSTTENDINATQVESISSYLHLFALTRRGPPNA